MAARQIDLGQVVGPTGPTQEPEEAAGHRERQSQEQVQQQQYFPVQESQMPL